MNPLDELKKLTDLFPSEEGLITKAEHTASALVPEPYKGLLVHESHMTVTMENYHKSTVDVRILDRSQDNDTYCRKIVLVKKGTDDVVQFGIVRFNFEYVTNHVRGHFAHRLEHLVESRPKDITDQYVDQVAFELRMGL